MLKWLLDSRVRESWARYSVAVYLGLLLAGTLSAQPPAPPQPAFHAPAPEKPPAWLVTVRELDRGRETSEPAIDTARR